MTKEKFGTNRDKSDKSPAVSPLGLNATELDGILYHFRIDLTLFCGRAVRWERRLLSGNLDVISP